jgi:acetolactate synthase-1/2/3 large subunit
MNGAESLVATAIAAGVELCFANPGTTELPLVQALDAVPGIRAVLCVHETVVTGAADGYARMAGKPALTLLHLGPGFANGIANLHNARRAHTPVVNLIGDHARWHRPADAPLTSDIPALAGAVSGFVKESGSAESLAEDFAETLAAAQSGAGQVATLIAAADHQWGEGRGIAAPRNPRPRAAVAGTAVDIARAALAEAGAKGVLFLGGAALGERGLKAAARIRAATGCALFSETFFARLTRRPGLPVPTRLPYFPDMAIDALAPFGTMVLAGARDPVAFFGYPGVPSRLAHKVGRVETLGDVESDIVAALEALADTLKAPRDAAAPSGERVGRPTGALTPLTLCQAIAACQPEDCVMMDEGLTVSAVYDGAALGAPAFEHLLLTGGAIGMGPAGATGAAIGAPGRKVINLQADGSALYTSQALWTQARNGLDVVTVICSNRSYQILRVEIARAGGQAGPIAQAMTDLGAVDWVSLAKGYGVPATRAETADALVAALDRALAADGPHLIEAVL